MVDVDNSKLCGADDRFLSKADMASMFRVTVRTLESWMRKQLVPYHKIGRTVRFDLRDVRSAFEARRKSVQQDSVCLKPVTGAAESLREAAQEIRNRRRPVKSA